MDADFVWTWGTVDIEDFHVDQPRWRKTQLLDGTGRPIYRHRPMGFARPEVEYSVDPDDKPEPEKSCTGRVDKAAAP